MVTPAHALTPPPSPTSQYFTTTTLPDPSEALALDPSTSTVYAMTEAESDGGGDVDTDAVVHSFGVSDVVTAAQCGEDEHNIAVIDAVTGAVKDYITLSGEAEYMAVDPTMHKLYVPQYNDAGLAAPQCLAVVDLTSQAVTYYSIPFTFVDPRTNVDTGYQYNPTGVDVDPATHIVYVGAKMPEIEAEVDGQPDDEWGQGAIMAFDPVAGTFLNTFVRAGDDPESLVFNRKGGKAGRIYTANEDEGTLTIANAVTANLDGTWNTQAFRGGTFTTARIFDPKECPAGTYQPAEADKLAVDDRTNMVYLTDDRFRVAAIPGSATDLSGMKILRLSPNGLCPTSADPEVYNYANNLALDPDLGTVVSSSGGKGGVLYVTSENSLVSVVDLGTFKKVGEMTITGALHIDWPVLNTATSPDRFFVTDEQRPVVYAYDVGERVSSTRK